MSGAGQGAGGPRAPGDPAMDDILASIRRILNEDEAAAPATPTSVALPSAPPEAEPFELTEQMMVAPPPPPAAGAAAGFEPPPPEPSGPPSAMPDQLVAPAVAAATAAALGGLLRTVAAERASPVHRGGPSIEDVVREELRPLLKSWLDQHLPPLVERLVRTEIERVVGRAAP